MPSVRSHFIRRALALSLIALQLNMLAMTAWADGVAESAAQAQQLGRDIVSGFSNEAAGATLQDIFPDTSGATSDLQEVFGSDQDTIDLGANAQARLKTEESMDGEAYRLISQSARRVSPDLSNDPLFNQADSIRNADFMSQFREEFADCSQIPVYEERVNQEHVSDLNTCERLVKPQGACDINHEVVVKAKPADIVFIIDNSSSMGGVIASLRSSVSNLAHILGQGNDGDLRLGGAVSRGSQYVSNHIQLTSDAQAFQNWVGSVAINGGTTYSASAAQWVANSFAWRENVEKVIVIIGNKDHPGGNYLTVKGNLEGGGFTTYIFHNNSAHAAFGTFIAPGFNGPALFKMAQFLTVVEDIWTPQSCVNAAISTLEEFCTGSYQVVAGGSNSTCVNLSGFDVCPGDPIYEQLREPPIPDVDRLATKVSVSAIECNYNEGAMSCWTDPQGVEHCPTNEGGQENSCEEYESNPSCGFISQSCVEGSTGSEGTCYVFNEIWDCGYSVDIPTVINTGTSVECPGGAVCMGTECFDDSNTLSGDFAYATAMLQVAQFAEHDLDCGPSGIDCKVFPGEAMECKKALGGYVDCCEAPEGVSVFDYVNLTVSSLKMASSVEAFNRTGNFFNPGYWQAAQGAASGGWSAVTSGNWSGAVDAATSAFNDTMAGEIQATVITEFKEQMMKMTYDFMKDMGADAAADAMFQQGATEGGMQLSSQAAAALNVIGAIYTAYVIADLMINIIWECEEKEFELAAKNETRQCSFVGSYCADEVLGACVEKRDAYCCFGSVVGRIIQEQGRPQLGLNFGEAEAPSCEGLTPGQLGEIDWNQIDLGEWIGMLSMTGNLPTVDTVGLDNLTGSGSSLGSIFSADEPRANTLDRNVYRLEDVDVDEIKRQAEIDALLNVPE